MATKKGSRKHIAHASAETKPTQKVKPQKEMGGIHDLIAMMEPAAEEFLLPSKGLVYPVDRVMIRPMTSREEKKIAAITPKNFNNQMNNILRSCVKGPVDFNPTQMTIGDRVTLITYLRIVTYGPEYVAEVTCPVCKMLQRESYNLNEDLKDIWLPDDYIEPYFVELEAFNGGISLRMMTVKDDIEVDQFLAKERKMKNMSSEDEWSIRFAKTIVDITVDGAELEDLRLKDKIAFFEGLPGKDSQKIRDFHAKYDHGVDLRVPFSCSNCEFETDTLGLNINASFFIPSRVRK